VIVIGLMSGTSLDGVDAAIVELDGDPRRPRWSMLAYVDTPYTAAQRERLHEAIAVGTAAGLCRLHAELGEWFAAAALAACRAAGVEPAAVQVIGSHGQTVWHEPPRAGARGSTLQLGCAATIAERTGISVVSDFRARDMAAGGEGAPLVSWVDRLLFRHETKRRVLQNIGGIANLSWLPPRSSDDDILAFDTGPGNMLMDAAVELATNGVSAYDVDGGWAARGTVDHALLTELLAHPFLQHEPPRSTGREAFGRPFVRELADLLQPADEDAWARLIRTLTEFSARSITDAIERWVLPRGVDEVVITGGGAHNPILVQRIRDLLAPVPVRADAAALGIEPAAKEALSFAVLAWAHVHRLAGNVPAATGAAGPRILGSFTPARASADAGDGAS
jgi:anhydro-N-acetylmuramic acid kinase